jgi:hypothetical protein
MTHLPSGENWALDSGAAERATRVLAGGDAFARFTTMIRAILSAPTSV